MPSRSRITTTSNEEQGCNLGTNVGNNGASTDWAYSTSSQPQQPQPRRTASLSRNLTRRSRSVTMPNMSNDSHKFSTFKRPAQQTKEVITASASTEAAKSTPSRSKSSSYLSHYNNSSHTLSLKNGGQQLSKDRSLLATSSTEGCLSLLAEEINDNSIASGDATPVASGTPDVSHHQLRPHPPSKGRNARPRPRPQLSSLDSLLNEPSSSVDYKHKSNSLPKSAFGGLQLRVAKIKAQLDTLNVLKTPTAPTPSMETALHPNTPSCGFEYSMPPNLTMSGNGSEESPLSSPNRQSPFTTMTMTSNSNSSSIAGGGALPAPPFLPLTMTTTTGGSSTLSSSPSTLSPASSNSLPSISRPQNLKLPQSHSLNTFPSMNNKESLMMMETEELNRLIFFFDVMSTQEKIAKV